MSGTIYRKAGRTFRAELLRGAFSTLEISEWGEAREDGSRFQARSSKHQLEAESPEAGPLLQLAERLQPLEVDRFVLLSGNVVHQIEDRSWTEQFARAFVSLRHDEVGVSFELGGRAPEDLDLKPVLEANSLLRRLQPARRQQTSITLAPHVAASLWPALAGSGAGIGQSRHPEFRFDGDGREIQEAASGAPWPNRFRPSYRARPVPAPFHLRASWKRSEARPDFSAIGVITPFSVDSSGIRARLLFREGFAAAVSFPVAALRGTDTPHLWFPYAAGSYAQETLVESAVLTP